jgi:hypothetical protein
MDPGTEGNESKKSLSKTSPDPLDVSDTQDAGRGGPDMSPE